MNTACEHCLFAILKNGKQTGCYHNRLDKFKKVNQATLESTGYYSIENYCNLCRNVYWNEYCYNTHDTDKLATIVREEEKIKFDALIDVEKATTKQLENIIKKLNTNKYQEYLNKVLLFGKMTEDNLAKVKGLTGPKVITNLNESDDKFTQSAHHVHKCVAHYLVFIQPGIAFDFDMKRFEKAMNDDLKPIVYENTKKQFIVSTFFYKSHIQYDNPIATIITEYDEYGKSTSERTDK